MVKVCQVFTQFAILDNLKNWWKVSVYEVTMKIFLQVCKATQTCYHSPSLVHLQKASATHYLRIKRTIQNKVASKHVFTYSNFIGEFHHDKKCCVPSVQSNAANTLVQVLSCYSENVGCTKRV